MGIGIVIGHTFLKKLILVVCSTFFYEFQNYQVIAAYSELLILVGVVIAYILEKYKKPNVKISLNLLSKWLLIIGVWTYGLGWLLITRFHLTYVLPTELLQIIPSVPRILLRGYPFLFAVGEILILSGIFLCLRCSISNSTRAATL